MTVSAPAVGYRLEVCTWGEFDDWVQTRLADSPRYPLYSWVPSLPYGQQVGWLVSGQEHPIDAFSIHQLGGGMWSGGGPVGLTPLRA